MADVVDLATWRATHIDSAAVSRIDEVPQEGQIEAAENLCLNAISRADRTFRELDDRLKHAGYPVEIRVRALELIERRGLVDEDRIAYRTAEKLVGRSTGTRLIAQRLMARGLAEESIMTALSSLDVDEAEIAGRLCADFLRANPGLDPEIAQRRLLGRLERKGFPADVSYQSVRNAFEN